MRATLFVAVIVCLQYAFGSASAENIYFECIDDRGKSWTFLLNKGQSKLFWLKDGGSVEMDVDHIDDAAINTSYKFKGGVEDFGANFRLDTNTVTFFWSRKPTNFEIMRCVEEAEKQGEQGSWCYCRAQKLNLRHFP